MSKNDFLNSYAEYIDTLKGSNLTQEQLTEWVKRDSEIWDENLTDQQIMWIVEEAEDNGKESACMYLQRDNGDGGLLISDENGNWYYFNASEIIPHSIIYPKKALIADNETDKINAMIESIRSAIETGDLYSAEDFISEYENDEKYLVKEYEGLTIADIDELENYETTYCGDRVPRNHDVVSWYKI